MPILMHHCDVVPATLEISGISTTRRFSIETVTGPNAASFTWEDPNGTSTVVDY
ncbi:hypothetical protein [Neolewinella aurantiaca]|uniref:hypothetical protein n=1 Tax=Neolewinella aurantiaca TaxID=2602767 RepID=UPI001C9BF2A1|nr:hypothetical protein [Neolewinella aurantiaca]